MLSFSLSGYGCGYVCVFTREYFFVGFHGSTSDLGGFDGAEHDGNIFFFISSFFEVSRHWVFLCHFIRKCTRAIEARIVSYLC